MGKLPFVNPNPNPNSNFNHFSKKQLNHQNGNELHHHHQTLNDSNHRKSNDVGMNGASLSHYVNYDISSLSKAEIRMLKTRLMSELDEVRSLSTRIDSGEFRNVSHSNHHHNNNNLQKKRPMPFQQQAKEPKRGKQHHHQQQSCVASPQVMKMCSQVLSKMMKQKASYVFNEPVDAVAMGLHDYHQIIKRPMDLGTIKKNLGARVYTTPDEFAADVRLTFNNALMYNPKGHEVHTLAERFLGKFEQYYKPIHQKFQWEKNQKFGFVGQKEDVVVVDEVQGSSWSRNPSPQLQPRSAPTPKVEHHPKKPEPRPEPRVEPPSRPEPRVEHTPRPEPRVEPTLRPEPRVEPTPRPEPPLRHEPAPELVQTPVQEVVRSGTGRGSGGKLPKPKAKDPNKREMNMEEKHKLGAGLQSLPEEKMTQVIQIIRKRNGHLTQEGDEIELDIEAVDTETLWELDRFVTNYKKMVSKLRRQALMDMQNNNVGHHDDSNQVGVSERVMETSKAAKRGGGDAGEEDVDIGDEMPTHNFPPVEIDKDDDRHQSGGVGGGGDGGGGETSDSSSSSSSGSSSSSSDSDSGSFGQ
ncbi:Transcription factor GTE7 [Bienertia sinuspersici]